MITEAAARVAVKTYVDALASRMNKELVVSEPIEHPFGWVFSYDSRDHKDSGNRAQALLGAAPIIVDRETGEVSQLTTARPPRLQLDAYQRKWDERHAGI